MLRIRKPSSSSIVLRTVGCLLLDVLRFVSLGFRSRSHLAAENLFLRKQLAFLRRTWCQTASADDATRNTLVVLARLTDWRAFPAIISHAVWLYYRFTVSFRDVEDLLAQRGITG